jgi:regulator of nucleoside diphosphate kinase
MPDPQTAILTSKDYALLEALLVSSSEIFSGAAMQIRRKLRHATLVFPADINADVVTLDSRVRFRVEGGGAEERVIVVREDAQGDGPTLALNCPRGIAMIGASAGDTVEVPRADGTFELLHIEAVLFQPEAHVRAKERRATASVVDFAQASSLRQLNAQRPRPATIPFGAGDDDDPGPSAA